MYNGSQEKSVNVFNLVKLFTPKRTDNLKRCGVTILRLDVDYIESQGRVRSFTKR